MCKVHWKTFGVRDYRLVHLRSWWCVSVCKLHLALYKQSIEPRQSLHRQNVVFKHRRDVIRGGWGDDLQFSPASNRTYGVNVVNDEAGTVDDIALFGGMGWVR